MKHTVVKFGLIAGGILSLVMIISFSLIPLETQLQLGQYFGYGSMLVAFSSIFFAVRSYRETTLNGVISFGKAFQIGLLISTIASVMYVITWMVMSSYFAQDFMQQYMDAAIANMKIAGDSLEDIEAYKAEMLVWVEYYKNPFIKAALTLMEVLPIGILISLISAIVLRKKAK